MVSQAIQSRNVTNGDLVCFIQFNETVLVWEQSSQTVWGNNVRNWFLLEQSRKVVWEQSSELTVLRVAVLGFSNANGPICKCLINRTHPRCSILGLPSILCHRKTSAKLCCSFKCFSQQEWSEVQSCVFPSCETHSTDTNFDYEQNLNGDILRDAYSTEPLPSSRSRERKLWRPLSLLETCFSRKTGPCHTVVVFLSVSDRHIYTQVRWWKKNQIRLPMYKKNYDLKKMDS